MTTMAIRPGDPAASRLLLLGLYLELSTELEDAAREARAVGDADHAGEDAADSGTRVSLREQHASLMASIERRRHQVAVAIERINAGTYGVCEKCGLTIPPDRLEAFPAGTMCVACKRAAERHR